MSVASLLGWKPENERRKVITATVASVLVHLLVIILLGYGLAMRAFSIHKLKEEEKPVVLTIVEPPPEPKKTEPDFVETTEAQRSPKPPEKTDFQSDKDTVAATENTAKGNLPVPTLTGEKERGLEMENSDYTAGKEPPRPAAPAAPPAQSATAEARPTPRPVAQLALLEPPEPKAQPRPSQTPEKTVTEQQPPQPQIQPQTQPVQPAAPAYQPQTRITRIEGSISNRGRRAVNAQATPMGRYKKMLSDAIGSRWYYYVNEQLSLLTPGTLEVRFIVKQDGKVEKVEVMSNNSNESFASCSVRAIMEAEIPPIPNELVPMLQGGRIEIDYSFTILSQ